MIKSSVEIKDAYCKPVENSFVWLLHDCHYWCIKARGTKAPTIDPGKLIQCKISCRASFDTEKVDTLDMDKGNSNNASDKNSEGNYKEKIPKKNF